MDQQLIFQASSSIGSFSGNARIELQHISSCGLPGLATWTGRPDWSTPSTPVHDRDGALPSDLQLAARRHVAVMARAAAARGSGVGAPKLVLRETGRITVASCRVATAPHARARFDWSVYVEPEHSRVVLVVNPTEELPRSVGIGLAT